MKKSSLEKKRHIVFFIDSLSGGGAERVCTLLANGLAERLYTVTVATIKDALPADYALNSNVKRTSFFAEKKSKSLLTAMTNNAALVLKLRKLIKTHRPDIVISFMTQSNIVCSLACLKLEPMHIASERNYPPLQHIGKAWNQLRKYLYILPTVVVSQTHKTDLWIKANTNCNETAVIPNPITFPIQPQAESNNSKANLSYIKDRNIILGVGRLVDQKQFHTLITVFSALANRYHDWALIIVGEGPDNAKLQQQIDDLHLQNSVTLMGKQSDMAYWYELADIFVLTSKFEGYPNALLEAMCYGVPPVSYNCDTGPASIIQHEYNGLLVPADNTQQLTDCISTLIESPTLRKNMGSNAKKILKNHSVHAVVNQWEAVFDT